MAKQKPPIVATEVRIDGDLYYSPEPPADPEKRPGPPHVTTVIDLRRLPTHSEAFFTLKIIREDGKEAWVNLSARTHPDHESMKAQVSMRVCDTDDDRDVLVVKTAKFGDWKNLGR